MAQLYGGRTDALYRATQMTFDMRFDGVPLVYSWPSRGATLDYTDDQDNAGQAAKYFRDFVEKIYAERNIHKLTIVAHSMGSIVVSEALDDMTRDNSPALSFIHQLILASPDIDRDRFEQIASRVTSKVGGVTVYAAKHDWALSVSTWLRRRPRLGIIQNEYPFMVPKVDVIDISKVGTDLIQHSKFADSPEILQDIRALIQLNLRPPDKRPTGLFRVESGNGIFWRY